MLDYILIFICKIIVFITGLLGGGTGLPGRIALKLRPQILKTLAKEYRVVLITGTNGKTTTAGMLKNIIVTAGKRAIISDSGANMKSGITSCLIKNHRFFKKSGEQFAVLEVDEAYMRRVVEDLSPEIIAVTNIFRDQLDRYGDVDNTMSLIEEACNKVPATRLVLNGDEPMLCDFAEANPHFYYGFKVPVSYDNKRDVNEGGSLCKKCGAAYNYHFTTFSRLGDWECTQCGRQRPMLNMGVSAINNISADSIQISFDGMDVTVPQPGLYNVYNALCASLCARLLGVDNNAIKEGILNQESRFGRQEKIKIDSHEIRLILVKNPAGANEAINSVMPDKESLRLGFMLTDDYGDGQDVSWIYDVDYEKLTSLDYNGILIGGTRAYDMAIRLKLAGLNTGAFSICEDYDSLLSTIKSGYNSRLYLFATYTAMVSFRKYLRKKGYIKKLWY